MMKDNDSYPQYLDEEELYKIRTSKFYDGYDYDGPKQIRKEVEPAAFKMKEEFKILPENPRYIIGNEGSVYDRKTGHRLTPTSKDSDIVNSYQVYGLEGVGIRYAHRLTAQMFLPDFNDPGKEVNHKYGNKRLNRAVDLDMRTPSENVQHAHDNDLIGCPLNHLKAEKGIQQNHTEKEIRDICELICQGYSDMDIRSIIMSKYQFLNYSAGFVKVLRYCSPIYQPKYWNIVKEYVDRFPDRRYRKFTDQDIEEFCKMLDKGMTSSQIAEALGIPDGPELRTTLSGLRSGLIYTDISSKYKNIQKIQRTRLSLEEAENIYVLAMKGYNSKEIAKMIGMESSQSFSTTVSQLKKGSIFGEIKQKYENTVFEQIERTPKYSDDIVRSVCDMISNRISLRRIAESTGHSIGEIRKLANDIITKSKYTEISSQYPNIGPLSKKLPIETVEKIYLLSTEGKRPAEIADILGIPMSHTFSGTVSKIRSGKSYPEVKEKYKDIEMPKFTSAHHPNPISLEQAEKIYLLYNDGSKPSEISSILGIPNTSNFRSSVHRIVHGKMYPEVYKKYNKEEE